MTLATKPDTHRDLCDWAACTSPAVTVEDGWAHCSGHLEQHRLIIAGQELPDIPSPVLRAMLPPDACGTEARAMQHRRVGETCRICHDAAQLARQLRWELNNGQVGHRVARVSDHEARCVLALSVLRARFDTFHPDVMLLDNVLTGVAYTDLVERQLQREGHVSDVTPETPDVAPVTPPLAVVSDGAA